MSTKDWILLIVPILINGVFSLGIILYQSRLGMRLKKIEKVQSRKGIIIDEYLKILTDLNNAAFAASAKFRLREELTDIVETLGECTNSLTVFINGNQFLLKSHIDRIEKIRAKCGYSICKMNRYISLGREACEKYPMEEQEALITDLTVVQDILQELKKEGIKM